MSDKPSRPELRQEEDHLPHGAILLTFVVLGLIGVFLVLWAWYGLDRTEQALRPSRSFPERELNRRRPPGAVRENIYGETGAGQNLNERKRQQLGSFVWIDRRRQIVAIPIEDSIGLVLQGREP